MTRQIVRALLLSLCIATPALAEDKPAAPSPEEQAMMDAYEKMGRVGEEHKRLAAEVGKWSYENTMWMDPAAPPTVSKGTSETVAIWGGRYIQTDFKGDFQGQPFEGRAVHGYDNLKGKYVSTWIDSMSTAIFITYGDHDAASKTTTYIGEMDDPMHPGKANKVREVVRWIDNDHWVFEWHETRDGKERKTMEIKYTRM